MSLLVFIAINVLLDLKEGYFGDLETNGVHMRILRILYVPRD